MNFKILISLLLLIILTNKSHQKTIVVYSNFKVAPNPAFISNFTVDWSLHDNTTDEPSKFVEPFSFTSIQVLQTVHVHVKVFHTDHGYVSFDQMYSICSFKRTSKINMFLRMISAELEKNINFAIKCPFKKGDYSFDRMAIPQFNMLSFIRTIDIFTTSLSFKTKIRNQLKTYLTLSIDWQLREVD